ncbi:MAG: hypothetical protein WCP55_23450, partial [Lentisphaerota bacterium]
FNCPSEPKAEWRFSWGNQRISYGLNISTFGYREINADLPAQRITNISRFGNDSNLIFLADSTPNVYIPSSTYTSYGISPPKVYPIDASTAEYQVYSRHGSGKSANVFFFDGHAASLDYFSLKKWTYWNPTLRGSVSGSASLRMNTGNVW